MKEYLLTKLSSIWLSLRLLFLLIFRPAKYAETFNSLESHFSVGLESFKFITILNLGFLYVINKFFGITNETSEISFNNILIEFWLLFIVISIFIAAIIYAMYRKSEYVNYFVGSVLFSFSSSFLIGMLASTISINYYNTINPQTSFGSGDSFDHFLRDSGYYLYPVIFLFLFVPYITCVNSYAVKKFKIMSFKFALTIHWVGIISSFYLMDWIGEPVTKKISAWLQVLLSVLG